METIRMPDGHLGLVVQRDVCVIPDDVAGAAREVL